MTKALECIFCICSPDHLQAVPAASSNKQHFLPRGSGGGGGGGGQKVIIILKDCAQRPRRRSCRAEDSQPDVSRAALMSETLEMFPLCRIPLVDLGQHFLCNLTVITKEGCAGKTQGTF